MKKSALIAALLCAVSSGVYAADTAKNSSGTTELPMARRRFAK